VATRKIDAIECTCDLCRHVWYPKPWWKGTKKKGLPAMCPECNTVLWNESEVVE
jgi:hypothetical protein